MEKKDLSKFKRTVISVDRVLGKVESGFCMATLFVMMCLVFFGVISRFILHLSIMWLEEVSIYLMCASVFIGVSLAYRERAHVGLTGLVDKLPKKICTALIYFRHFFCMFTFAFCSYQAVKYISVVRKFNQKTAALRWPMYIVYLPLAIGLILTFVRTLMVFWNDIMLEKPVLEEHDDEVLAN